MFSDRIDFFLEAVGDSEIDDGPKGHVEEMLLLLRRVDIRLDADGRLATDGSIAAPRYLIERRLSEVRGVLADGSNIDALEWVTATAAEVAASLERGPIAPGLSYFDLEDEAREARKIGSSAAGLLDRYALHRDRDLILREARQAVEQASNAAELAQESAGIAGGASISKHFHDYAKGERLAAEVFRGLVIVCVLAALAATFALGPVFELSVVFIVSKIALVGAAGTLAGYFARQAGQHRRIYDWAKGLEVQLRSFPAFIERIPEDDRTEVYRLFAHRVLSAPPGRGGETRDENLGASQVMELLTVLAKRLA